MVKVTDDSLAVSQEGRTPTLDQSYCDVRRHSNCTGYTEDDADPETCLCACHDPEEEPND